MAELEKEEKEKDWYYAQLQNHLQSTWKRVVMRDEETEREIGREGERERERRNRK